MNAIVTAWLVLAAATPSPTPTATPTLTPIPPISILINKGSTGATRGQTLSDVARHIKLRTPDGESVVLDNDAVRRLAQGVELTSGAPASALPRVAPSSALDEARKANWQRAYADAVNRIPALEKRVAELQGEAARLQRNFYSWDDPVHRDAVIKIAWDKALADLAAAQQELEAARNGPEAVLAAADREGALPGWFREPVPTAAPTRRPRREPTPDPGVSPDATPTPRRPPTATPYKRDRETRR